ncbi:MAG: hypothetical protein Q4P15_00060 [Propionibacteriaceae bacterium]|nr:hypothetical protein [Propionibacteriaceae bacterium]
MRKKLIAGAAAASLAVGLGMTQFAQAETPTPSPTPSATSSTLPGDTTPARGHHEDRGHHADPGHRGHEGSGLDVSALASALGLPESDVSDAVSVVRQRALDARPQHTSPAERHAARESHRAAFAKALAEELGIEETEVTQAMEGLQRERSSASSAREKAALDQAVTDGTLTQSEADVVQKAIDEGIVSIHRGGHGRR